MNYSKIIAWVAVVIIIIILIVVGSNSKKQKLNTATPDPVPAQTATPEQLPETKPTTEKAVTKKPVMEPEKTESKTVTTTSGLKYEVINNGTGTARPIINSVVKVHYHGTLENGTVFDSSVVRGEPIEFPLNGVIKGWQEGLQLMNVGDKFKFTIPADLAYGPMSPSPLIPPNSTLVFEVELLGIK